MPGDANLCSFATHVIDLVPDRPRARAVFGLAVHTSSRTIVRRAERRGEEVLEHVVGYYQAARYSAHYVGGWDGTLVQLTPDDRMVPHIGVSADERRRYLDGRWRTDARLRASSIDRWRLRWSGRSSPQHLFPGPSANGVYVGIELPPLITPTAEGLWYTDEQHALVARLFTDLAERHGWDGVDAAPHPRLLGHEDLDAYGRWDPGGGWDPGALRATPRFDWSRVAAGLG